MWPTNRHFTGDAEIFTYQIQFSLTQGYISVDLVGIEHTTLILLYGRCTRCEWGAIWNQYFLEKPGQINYRLFL